MIVTWLSKTSYASDFVLAAQPFNFRMFGNSSAAEEPCISNGGSPFRFYDCPRITDAIFTEPYGHLCRYCGMTSMKSMSDIGNVRHRVDNLSTKNSSKEYLVALLSFLSHKVTACHKHLQLTLRRHVLRPASFEEHCYV